MISSGKQVRKYIAILTAASLMTALTGCGSGKTSENTSASAAESSAVTNSSAAGSSAESGSSAISEAAVSSDSSVTEESTSSAESFAESSVESAEEETADGEKMYKSADGWQVTYDPSLIAVDEDGGEVNFVYQGKSSGSDLITVSYVKEEMPKEALYELISEYDEDEVIEDEGFFGAEDGLWSYSANIDSDGSGSGLNDDYIAIEHNGGTVIVEILTHTEKKEERAERISDCLSAVLDTFTFTDNRDQEEFSYVPGTYVHTGSEEIEGEDIEYTDTIILNADHTGTMEIQDTVDLIWTSTEFLVGDDEDIFEYTVEGDYLYVKAEGDQDWTEYQRQ